MNISTLNSQPAPEDMSESAAKAASFLKALAHEGRLMILCHLVNGERSVGELEELLSLRQAAVSQMLARLRDEGMVHTRRAGKTVYYSLKDQNAAEILELLYKMFCGNAPADAPTVENAP